MSEIQRARNTTTGTTTIIAGDLVVATPTNGIVMTDNVGDTSKIQIIDDSGVKTLVITEE